jgi:pSer/pThr/pTyr-binding forkhead associated (FHA) protein
MKSSWIEISLVVAEGRRKGESVLLKRFPFLIGESPECQLRLSSERIAEQHCRIDRIRDRVTVTDLGGVDGTCVNGSRIESIVEVGDGDDLRVGPLMLTFRMKRHQASESHASEKLGDHGS